MPDFSVRIISSDEGAQFDPLSAPPASIVTWDNRTSETHQVTLDTFSTDPIPAGGSSRPSYMISTTASGTLTYFCTLHDNESGSIEVTQVVPIPPESEPC